MAGIFLISELRLGKAYAEFEYCLDRFLGFQIVERVGL